MTSAKRMAKRLKLPPHRAVLFERFFDRLGDLDHESTLTSEAPAFLSEDIFQVVRHWYHGAIVCLTDLPDFDSDPRWIAKRIRITPVEAELAVDRMVRLGLLIRGGDGRLTKSQPAFRAEDIPSEAKRQFHRQMLQKATVSVEQLSVDERHVTGVMVAVNEKALEKVRAELERVCYQLRAEMKSAGDPDRVFYLGIQLFPVDTASASSCAPR